MNRIALPRTAASHRVQALVAAVIVTVAVLSAIDALAGSDAPALVATAAAPAARG